MHILRNLVVAVTAGAAVISSQLTVDDSAPWDMSDAAVPIASLRLETASNCADLTDRVREVAARAEKLYEESGYDGGGPVVALTDSAGASGDSGAAPTAPTVREESAQAVAGLVSKDDTVVGTNIQELGVDETDIVKSDGETIFVLREGALVSVDADTLTQLDVLKSREQFPYDLLLADDRVILFESTWRNEDPASRRSAGKEAADSYYYNGKPILRITTVDVSDPSDLLVDSVTEVDGALIAARMVGGYVRVVTSTTPNYGHEIMPMAVDLPATSSLVAPGGGGPEGLPPEKTIEQIDAMDVLPSIEVKRRNLKPESFQIPCDQVHVARDAETLETTTVFSLDPLDPKPIGEATAMTGGSTVYANTRSIYVTRQQWSNTGRSRTEFHRFDITDPLNTKYVSVGRIGGHLLNQFSMSEHEGLFRVATTDNGYEANGYRSESKVTIFEERGDRLVQTGSVGGLGETEQIFAVRFIGELGYVVTFRQTDPLYVIDLSDATAPKVTGELKIPGYSAYLHPVGEGYLIGVGQDADAEGQTKGVQVSLFDVRDPANPKRIAQLDKLGDYSSLEYDHRAFQYLADRNLIVVPASSWRDIPSKDEPRNSDGSGSSGSSGSPEEVAPDEAGTSVILPDAASSEVPYQQPQLVSYAYLIEVTPAGLREVARITHRGLLLDAPRDSYRTGEILRSIAIGNTMFTLSDAGLSATDLDSKQEAATLPW